MIILGEKKRKRKWKGEEEGEETYRLVFHSCIFPRGPFVEAVNEAYTEKWHADTEQNDQCEVPRLTCRRKRTEDRG